jgi:hypothetical protein
MLNSHPLLAVANDTHFIPRAVAGFGETDPVLTDELADRVWNYHRFHRLGLSRADVNAAADGARSYSEFVSRIYDAFGRHNGKPLAGEKTPDYGRHIPYLHELVPRARFVHIVRDGRDVALSTLDWATPRKGPGRWTWWDTHPVATCALWWRWQVEGALTARTVLGPEWVCEIRYEDLVEAPGIELRRIAGFLGLDYDDSMERFNEGKMRPEASTSAKSAWLPPISGLRDWRHQMDSDDLAVFQSLTGDVLGTLGYAKRTVTVSGEVVRIVEEARAWWRACNGRPVTRRRAQRVHETSEVA